MYTIKHIDDYGNEHLFEASQVRVVRPMADSASGDPPQRHGVEITTAHPADAGFSDAFYPFRSAGEPRQDTGYQAAIFVMNRHGATVARHLL